MKHVLAALLLLAAPVLALAQTVTAIPMTGVSTGRPAPAGQAVLSKPDIEKAFGAKQDTLAMQAEAIAGGNPGIARNYFGRPSYPNPGLWRQSGPFQVNPQLGSWGSQTNALSVVPNVPLGVGIENTGNQGGFWDRAYRTAYDGQDQAAIYVWMRARPAVLVNAGVSSYGTVVVATPAGPQTAYTVTLATALTPAQRAAVAALPPSLRVETGNGLWSYLIPRDMLNAAGQPVPPVSADGTTLVVDGWARLAPTRVEATSGTQPTAAAGGGNAMTVSLDVVHQIDDSYGGWRVADTDQVRVAMGDERVFINARSSIPALNLYDPLTTGLLTVGTFLGVVDDNGGVGQGTAAHVCTQGWQACFVARNVPGPSGRDSFGFLAPYAGPTWGYVSTQGAGYVIGVDPGNSCGPAGQQAVPGAPCLRTYLLDTQGNSSQTGTAAAGTVQAANLRISLSAQVNGTTSFYNTAGSGRSAYVNGDTGQIFANGFIVPGSSTVALLPSCSATYLGAQLYVSDARKPGEAAGAGSGVTAHCTAPSRGAAPGWASVYDHAAVVN